MNILPKLAALFVWVDDFSLRALLNGKFAILTIYFDLVLSFIDGKSRNQQ